MSTAKETIKKITPAPLLNAGRDCFDSIKRLGNIPQAYWSEPRRDTMEKLAALKDSKKGERCFIIGNGPSLKDTDLSKLRNENTFGLNRIYLAFPDMGFQTTYYLCVNGLVLEQTYQDIEKLTMPRFVAMRAMEWMKPADNLFFLYSTYTGPTFAKDIRKRMWEGATVTYMALQTAFYIGFSQVILIGVDHSFATKGKPNETVVSQGDDPNHFNAGYFGKGFRWQLPDLDTSERSYTLARETYKAAGREVIDATVGGKLQVFPKVDYNTLF